MRMIWLSQKDEDVFLDNLHLLVSVGSWKDIITMLQYDLVYNGWNGRVLNWKMIGALIAHGLSNGDTVNLLKKYLPQLKAASNCKTVEAQADNLIAKWICSILFGPKESSYNYKKYRNLKVSGTAHEWQQLISKGQFNQIDFNKIHGRALNLLAKSKFLKNQGLEDKYKAWITKPETQAKYVGFVHELFKGLSSKQSHVPTHVQETINKQFDTLVNKAKEEGNTSNLIVVRDTSGSMDSDAIGTGMSCGDVAKALALYFSQFLKGKFSNAWIEFNSQALMHTWKGRTPIDKWYNDTSGYVGSTNFQSVIKLFCNLKIDRIDEKEFPSGILCISDGEFNTAECGRTNVEAALDMLRSVGFSEEYVNNFVIVLWNLQNRYYGKGSGSKFETFGTDTPNVFYLSGYSAATVGFISGKIKNAGELLDEALNQEVLKLVKYH